MLLNHKQIPKTLAEFFTTFSDCLQNLLIFNTQTLLNKNLQQVIKYIFTPIFKIFIKSNIGLFIEQYVARFAEWLRYEKSKFEHEVAEARLKAKFADLTIIKGYFKGLKYPGFISFGSSLFPKLSGNYESELFSTLEELQRNDYSKIIDIGCAEGYYAVGLAIKFKNSIVYAFDIDNTAQELAKNMSKLNAVDDIVIIKGQCTSVWLGKENFSKRSLIISDCEGFEKDLFVLENITNLYNCDLIIELHPMFNSDIKNYLCKLFGPTHQLQIISSKDDARKIFELGDMYQNFSYIDKLKLVQEGRMFTMDWLVAISKNPNT